MVHNIMKKRWFYGATIFFLLIIALTIIFIQKGRRSESIRTAGIVEGIEVNISSKVAGRISYLRCKEGDAVRKGNTIVKLEAQDLQASVRQASAGIDKAKANIRVSLSAIVSSKAALASAEADIASAEADMEKYRVQREESKREMDRAKSLFEREVIPQETLDITVANYDVAVASHNASEAKLTTAYSKRDAARAQLNMAESQLFLAKAGLRESEAILLYNRVKLADTIIKSPLSGTVVFKALEKGETVSPGTTMLTIVDMNNLYVRVDIEETLVDIIMLDAVATIRTEGESKRVFKGRVSEIGRYAEFATQRDVLRGRQDIKTFRVKIDIDDPAGILKPGMTVEAEIMKGEKHGTR
ncbi:MAG TPA: HlyD family secretion protein [Candidatus Brocadiaceae bacterium]